jgi:phosphoglycolate phosphatase-like HAD superfamily hydrolase
MSNTPNRQYDLILFDFHGVFTSNVGRTTHALVDAARAEGITDPDELRSLLRKILTREKGIPVRDFIRQEYNSRADDLERDNTDYAVVFEQTAHLRSVGEHMQANYAKFEETQYIPQYSWMIPDLHMKGADVAIVSNGRMRDVNPNVDAWGWRDHIRAVYARGQGGYLHDKTARKPAAEPIEMALENLQSQGVTINRDKTLYVGDHQHDIMAATESRIHSALILSGPGQLKELRVKPNFFLTLNHLPPLYIPENFRDVPVKRMRELPNIVEGEQAPGMVEYRGGRGVEY